MLKAQGSLAKEKSGYSDYFEHNNVIVQVLSLFCGFLFTSLTILLTWLQNKEEILAQTTILFITVLFYVSLYVLLDNLEMRFHYIENIPPLTLKIRPFFNLLMIFYLFGTATIMMLLLSGLFTLSLISAVIWAVIVILSINSTVKRFYKQSITRYWKKED